MNKIGITLILDEVGRVLIPSALCKSINAQPGDKFSIQVKDGNIVISKKESVSYATLIRKMDKQRRIVIPKEIIDHNNFEYESEFYLSTENDVLILTPAKIKCIFCNNKAIIHYKSKGICIECLNKIKGVGRVWNH